MAYQTAAPMARDTDCVPGSQEALTAPWEVARLRRSNAIVLGGRLAGLPFPVHGHPLD